jgi:lambda family phage portal protein
MREIFQTGEVLVRFRPRYASDGLLVPLQLQVIPSEHLPYMDNRINGSNAIRSGIEFTPYGKRAAYWMWREHPGLGLMTLGNKPNEQVQVSADNVLHMFLPRSAGQYRGEPWLAPVMVTLYELDQFVDAVLIRQKLANMFLGWQKRANPEDPGPMLASSTDPGGGSGESGVGFGLVEPGTMLDLDDGDTLEFNTPPGPGAEFGSFLKVMLHVFSAGVGVPYEQNTWDLEGVNYSSIRSGLLEFRRRCEQFQFQVMAFQFCRPTWRRWIRDAVLAGLLPTPTNDQGWRDLYSVEWRTPAWDWVDPLKDVMAKKMEVRCGFTSRSAVIHERGYDPEQIEKETADDNARSDKAGTVYDSDPRQTAGTGAAQAEQDQAASDVQQGKAVAE